MQKNNRRKKWFLFLLISGFILKLADFLFRKNKRAKTVRYNFKGFIEQEKKEIYELETGRENLFVFCSDSWYLAKDYFIPHRGNKHKPKILRTKSLALILIGLIFIKAVVASYLFFVYPNQGMMEEKIGEQLITLINDEREKNNLPDLKLNLSLSAAALAKADNMSGLNYFSHYGPDGKKPWEWINRSDYAYILAGENLAMNFYTAESVHAALMNSTAHRDNILNASYQDVGLAVINGEINGARTNILVELFGSRNTPGLAAASENKIKADAIQIKSVDVSTTTVLSAENFNQPAGQSIKVNDAGKVIKNTVIKKSAAAWSQKKNNQPTTDASSPENITASSSVKIASASTTLAKLQQVIDLQILVQGRNVLLAKIETEKYAVISANSELELKRQQNVAYAEPDITLHPGFIENLIAWSRNIFIVSLVIISCFLLLTIFIKIGVQHQPVILETILFIISVSGLMSIHIHFLEGLVYKIMIL
jgi:hypothetical protein